MRTLSMVAMNALRHPRPNSTVWPISLRPVVAFLVGIADRRGDRITRRRCQEDGRTKVASSQFNPLADPTGSNPL